MNPRSIREATVVKEKARILVLVEKEGQNLASLSYELFGIGGKLANASKGTLCAAVVGNGVGELSRRAASFVDEVYCLDHALLGGFQAEFYAGALEQLYGTVNPDILIMGHTLNNLDLAPRIAYGIGAQMMTDCVDLGIDSETGNFECAKPVYGAKIMANFHLTQKPYVVTFRPKTTAPAGPSPHQGEVIPFDPELEESLTPIVVLEEVGEEDIRLDKADAIVAGGRGIGDADGLRRLEEFITVLRKYFHKVEMGASRPLVDKRIVPSYRQIGATGEKVAPELYIAVGISGSLQHLTGMLNSKNIIAINNNPKAPIFEVAHYGVVADFEEVVPAIVQKLEELS